MSTTTSRLTQEWQTFWLAVSFLTRIPLPVRIDYSQQRMNNSSMYFPLVGLLLGGIYASVYTALGAMFSPLVSVLLVMGLHLWLTGAFHEDGLADSVDALGGGYTVEDRLRIMKDSRIGTYGAVALTMTLALKAALLLDAQPVWLALMLAPAISRFTPLLMMHYLPYVTLSEHSKTKPVASGFPAKRLGFAFAVTLLIVAGGALQADGLLLTSLLATAGVALVWGRYLKTQLGGYTGDALGASVILSELVLLMGLTI
ncbi:adenosylcobinamide-GDP ribazoletransferase [Marinobacter halodurans]|uniref:Adenosylcobinamide-GDP ribazoletransferase n=1 Tax=Marinobacter halodurans TaxID=2528979 RepID=A0ABY1ZIE6_9GAMM|nr:adenosylcobinamide-GDP ribazoletransferase [Marinobacter halodurans]TBW50337.1 adenosylcobinamide-GDP ribazoletransferase [Marinobacter halodurans]